MKSIPTADIRSAGIDTAIAARAFAHKRAKDLLRKVYGTGNFTDTGVATLEAKILESMIDFA